MSDSSRYEAPYHWWGPGPAPTAPLTLRDLLLNRTIDVERAAMLWAVLAQHQSLTVIGGPSGLGKSTLLHAFLPALPAGTHQLYLRGCYETFAFHGGQRCVPSATALLVNEISPHLPIYLWGPAVERTLAAGEAGYQILATAHGRSVVEFVASLTGSPLRIPARMLATLGLVVLLEPAPDGVERRVTELWQLSVARDGVTIDRLLPGELPGGVTARDVATARDALPSFAAQDLLTSTTAAAAKADDAHHYPTPAHSGSHLERTPAGE